MASKKANNYISVKYSASVQDLNLVNFFNNVDLYIDNGALVNENITKNITSNAEIKDGKVTSVDKGNEYDYWAPMEDVVPTETVTPKQAETVSEPEAPLSDNRKHKKELAKKQREEAKRLKAELRKGNKEEDKIAINEGLDDVNAVNPESGAQSAKPEKAKKPRVSLFSKKNKDNQPKAKEPKFKMNSDPALQGEALTLNFEGEDAVKSEEKVLYEYVAKDAEGKTIKGYFEAYSKVEVHSFLLSEGYEVYSIRTNKWIQFLYGGSKVNTTKVKIKDLIFFLTQLSTYIKAGIPLVEALKILSRQFRNKAYKRIFEGLIYDLTMGDSFSEALTKQNEAFPKLLINMIKASEMTGELPEALDDMAEYYTETDKTRKQMITAMLYPTIIFIISIGVMTFIMLFVIPKFVQIYESMDNAAIPDFTLAILAISEFMQAYAVWIFIAIIIFCFMFAYLYRTVKEFRTVVQRTLMHIPVVKDVIIYNEVTMFTKTFSSLLSHNVFITDSMDILNKLTNNEIYKSLILDTITNLAKGEKISTSFKDHWAFPIPAYEMIVTGERTGQLAEMMAKVSSYYQELHSNMVTRIKTFVEPVLIIFLTVMVGIIVLAIVIPMFNMYSAIQA